MNQANEAIYQALVNQIQPLLNEQFAKELKFGKYSCWALNLTVYEIISMLSAIGNYGRLGVPCPDINMRNLMVNKQNLEINIPINEEQQKALIFLIELWLKRNPKEISIPFEYSKESPHFVENVNWAINLTSSDLFGIIWHIGGFASRNVSKRIKNSIDEYSYSAKAQEPLICLMRVAQGQLTYYQLAGQQFPLREHQQVLDNP